MCEKLTYKKNQLLICLKDAMNEILPIVSCIISLHRLEQA